MSSTAHGSALKKQLVPFIIIGIGCAVLDFGVTFALTKLTPLTRTPAKAVGWCVGTLAAYLLNSRFAFRAEVTARKAGAVIVLYATTLAVQLLIYDWAARPLEALGFHDFWRDLVSFVIAQGVATVTNFVLQRRVIFRQETKMIASAEPTVVKHQPPMGDENPPVPPSAVSATSE